MTQEDEILELQNELQENPKSPQFVKLAELYLSRDMKDEAELLVTQSLKFHPNSTSGLILIGRIFKLKKMNNEAIGPLTKATKLASDNWKAWLELAETYLELKNGKLALQAFKRVMFINPTHQLARRASARLELLTADEYESELFQMQKLPDAQLNAPSEEVTKTGWTKPDEDLLRVLSYIDALIVRHDAEKAIHLLNECSEKYGQHPEIESRRLKLSVFEKPDYLQPKSAAEASKSKQKILREKKLQALQKLLRRIETKKSDLLST